MVAASLFHCLQLILYPWFFRKVGDAQGGQKLDMSKGEETVTAVKETTVGTETKSGLESMTCPRTSRDRFRSRCKSPVRSIYLQGLLPCHSCPVAGLALDHSPSPPLPLLFLLSSHLPSPNDPCYRLPERHPRPIWHGGLGGCLILVVVLFCLTCPHRGPFSKPDALLLATNGRRASTLVTLGGFDISGHWFLRYYPDPERA